MTDTVKGGTKLLQRALELEDRSRFTEALVCYQEGLEMFMEYLKVAPPAEKKSIRDKIEHFMDRAELLKGKVEDQMKLSTYHEEIAISANDTGYGYESVFGRFLRSNVQLVKIEDPYIRQPHQFNNLLRFFELLVKKCPYLKKIILVTMITDQRQSEFFAKIIKSLKEREKELYIVPSTTLHDRKVTLNNGWIFKLGKGLDYFKAPASNYSLGSFDLDLRPCHETHIDIYYSKREVQ